MNHEINDESPAPLPHDGATPADHSPCDGCGLCCEHLLVGADVVDVAREPRIESVRPLGKRHVHLSILDACWIIAAPGMPCAFLKPDKRCEIYPTRPQNCVGFVPGCNQCQDLREEHGLPRLVLPSKAHDVLTQIMKAAIRQERKEQRVK